MGISSRAGRVAAAGAVFGAAAAVAGAAGVTFANTPSTLQTCSHVSKLAVFGKPHITYNGTCGRGGVLQTWIDERYQQLMLDARSGKATTSYSGMSFVSMSMPVGGISGSTATDGIGDFSRADFTNAAFFGATWNNDNFLFADFNSANLANSVYHSDNFSDADLTNATLFGSDFTGSDMASVVYANTTCPNGTNSATHVVAGLQTCAGQGGGL